MAERKADEIFKEFKEHSIAEFFKKNRQMLGYSGKVRSLVTIVHEYVTNSLDACEEAGILPSIKVSIKAEESEEKYRIIIEDNGPGIPKAYVGKALATILAGTKFNRYVQQRGQQGIGAAGCTLYAQITTGKPIHVASWTGTGDGFECDISIDTVKNRPVTNNVMDFKSQGRGLRIEGVFGDLKYENSEHGALEYLKRTALSNPHAEIIFVGPDNTESIFPRSTDIMPTRPAPTKPHPLGLSVNDLLEFAHLSKNTSISEFLLETFSRVSQNKVNEIRDAANDVDFKKQPKEMSWIDAEKIIKALKDIKWISPESTNIRPIGEEQIRKAMQNIFMPEFMHVIERKPRIFRGGIPFVVESAVSYGGGSGKKTDEGYSGTIMRFANRVPLLFDSGTCAISYAIKGMDWKRYNLDIEKDPVSIFVNVSSPHIPYSGVGKESIAQEDDIIDEIKLAVMEASRGVQRYVSGKMNLEHEANRYEIIMRYAKQLSRDLSSLTGKDQERIEGEIESLVESKFPKLKKKPEENSTQLEGLEK